MQQGVRWRLLLNKLYFLSLSLLIKHRVSWHLPLTRTCGWTGELYLAAARCRWTDVCRARPVVRRLPAFAIFLRTVGYSPLPAGTYRLRAGTRALMFTWTPWRLWQVITWLQPVTDAMPHGLYGGGGSRNTQNQDKLLPVIGMERK